MTKVINGIFSILKLILLMVAFIFSFVIIINMYKRLDKNYVGAIFNFIPYLLLFVLFVINILFKQKSVSGNIFYNITCCLVFSVIIIAGLRTFLDKNMVIILKLGYGINFNYFADIIAPMRAMMYLLALCNVMLMIDGFLKNKIMGKKQEVVESNEDVKEKNEVPVKKEKVTSKSEKVVKPRKPRVKKEDK